MSDVAPNLSGKKNQRAWAMYDWANSAFSTTIMAGFFPLFFKQYWSAGTEATTSTFYLGAGNSLASLIIVLAAPVLGAMADNGGIRKRMLASFACAGVLATIGLFFVGLGMWPLAIVLYVVGLVGWSGANIFYDALLMVVSNQQERHRVSALGYALGYLGGGILFALNVVMTLKPGWFGLADTAEAVRWSFISVAVWWVVFTIPLLVNVREPQARNVRSGAASEAPGFRENLKQSTSDLLTTIRNVGQYRNVAMFLAAYWLYIDGVATIVKMAVDYGLSIGLPANSLIIALLLVQFIGFPATLFFGHLAENRSAKTGLWIGLWVYVIATAFAYFMDTSLEFYILACVLGLVQGCVNSLSRSLFSRLIPQDRGGEFFGFLNMVGKAAAVIGPILVGYTAYLTKDPRLGLLSVLILFFGGMFFLLFVKEEAIGESATPDHGNTHQ